MTPDIQKEIKEALEKATPGPWKSEGGTFERGDKRPSVITYFDTDHGEWFIHGDIADKDDAHLIANAPTWLSHLLELIEQLQEREFNHYPITIAELESRIFAQQDLLEQKDAEIEQLRGIQRAIVVLTPMQRMSKAMEIIANQKGAST
jgi:hypothetical protein